MPRSAKLTVAAVAVAMVGGTTIVASAGADAAESRAAGADITSIQTTLSAVAALSPTDVWAVGQRVTPHRFIGRSYILHGDGASWQKVRSPSPHASISYLAAVGAAGADDIWAVGGYSDQRAHALIQHWDGDRWRQVPASEPSDVSNLSLEGVSALSPTDAWAVGGFQDLLHARTLTEHWDGTRWQRVPSPSPDRKSGVRLLAVDAVAADDAWAVGYSGIGDEERSLIEHWDGNAWKVVSAPKVGHHTGNELTAIAAVSADDIWAAGTARDASGGHEKAITLHWNGTAWRSVPSVDRKELRTSISSLSAVSSDDVWAVGVLSDNATFIEHWDGTAWTQAASPNPGQRSQLDGVATAGASTAWAVGQYSRKSRVKALVEHWDGTGWTRG